MSTTLASKCSKQFDHRVEHKHIGINGRRGWLWSGAIIVVAVAVVVAVVLAVVTE